MRSRTRSVIVVLLVTMVAGYRLSLIDRGATALVDETLYFTSVMTLQSLAGGDLRGAAANVAVARAHQGTTLLQLPVAVLQAIPSAFGIPASNLRSLMIPAVFNVAVSLATLWFFFKIAVAVCGDADAAGAAAVVYALLVNSNLYVRHMLPYDLALSVGAGAAWLAMTRRPTISVAAGTGLLAGAVITIYPGYYLLSTALGMTIVGCAWSSEGAPGGWNHGARRAIQAAAAFALGVATILAAMELLCRAGGISYIESSRAHARTITLGSFDEGWTFLPVYLLRIEHVSGVALLGGTVVGLWRAASRFRRGIMRPFDWLMASALVGWALQAALSAQWHVMVVYGRLIHPWLFFMALALADSMAAINRRTLRLAACAAAAAAALISWAPSALAYARLAYPPDVLYALRVDTTRLPPSHMLCDLGAGTSYASPGPLDRATRYPYTSDTDYLLINFCQAAPSSPPTTGVELDARARLYDGPHWLTFPAYGFEGVLDPAARDQMARSAYRVRAYRLSAITWTPTSEALVDKMLELARVTSRDVVVDLGSGDGRMAIAAARRHARATGIDANAEMVRLARRNADKAGVGDRAAFLNADLLEADLSPATVITMFLSPGMNLQLRPKILDLKPGTRIVSNTFTMNDWRPDDRVSLGGSCQRSCNAWTWIVPAKAQGAWRSAQGELTLRQEFQVVSGTLKSGSTIMWISDGRLRGDQITFTAGGARYSGQVDGASMTGTVTSGSATSAWTATRIS